MTDEITTIEDAQRAAVAEFPSVAPFADLLVGETADNVREVARDIASRLAAGSNAEVTDDEPGPSLTDWTGFAPVTVEPLTPAPREVADDPMATTEQKWAAFTARMNGAA